ncbi:MAG: M20/M25/M40 family metallo-hydrolase [Leptolyngbyaceae cyanobacterium MO_188.B28]|nr:M20/M25/M40 family metallo-hydrolase [Leptolyngbyaceae cyanobacterium MO_188.B28]
MSSLTDRLTHHLTQVARDRDPYLASVGHFFVQQYIQRQLQQWGAVEQQTFSVQSRSHCNLILRLPPAQPERRLKPPILVGAHYDAVVGSPGADDNATGVAALLEMARLLTEQPPRSPVHLVAFDLEEYGLLGSRHYADQLKQQKQPLRLMISLEMLGYRDPTPDSQQYPPGLKYFYPNRGDFLGLIGNWRAIPDLIRLCRTIRKAGVACEWLPVPQAGELIPDTRRSDHAPFWDQGYRSLMATDTANLRNPHYHQHSDSLDTLDLDFLTRICQGLVNGIRQL